MLFPISLCEAFQLHPKYMLCQVLSYTRYTDRLHLLQSCNTGSPASYTVIIPLFGRISDKPRLRQATLAPADTEAPASALHRLLAQLSSVGTSHRYPKSHFLRDLVYLHQAELATKMRQSVQPHSESV